MNEENFTQSEPVQIQEPKKNNIAIIAVIIVIVAITAGVVGWLVARKTQTPIVQPVVTQPVQQAPATQPVVSRNFTVGSLSIKYPAMSCSFDDPKDCRDTQIIRSSQSLDTISIGIAQKNYSSEDYIEPQLTIYYLKSDDLINNKDAINKYLLDEFGKGCFVESWGDNSDGLLISAALHFSPNETACPISGKTTSLYKKDTGEFIFYSLAKGGGFTNFGKEIEEKTEISF